MYVDFNVSYDDKEKHKDQQNTYGIKHMIDTYVHKGPFTRDVRLKPEFLDPFTPASG